MRSTRTVACLALAAFATVLAACGDDDDAGTEGDSSTTTAAATADAPEGLVDDGELTVCSDTPYEPFEFEGPDGEQTGYDIDILRAIAGDAGLDLEVLDLPFEGILGSLAAGQCDVVASAVTITDERKEQVDFSDPYFDADQSLLVRADEASEYTLLDNLANERIAVQAGTTGEEYANANKPEGAEIVSFEDADGMFGALTSGDVAAVLQDLPVNSERAKQDDAFVVTATFPTGEQYGYAIEKGDTAVLEFVNAGLAALEEDGRLEEIYDTYFGESE
jgi:polar amino acid transport system substrate-binding protein